MAATTTRRTRLLACAIALASVLAAGVGVAAAAETTSIGVSPASDSIARGETTEVDLVVANADGGVGALNATVSLSNPDVASIESVTFRGDPGLSNVTRRGDGVELSAALAETDDSGSVTIATVVVRGDAPGVTEIGVDVRALGDEDGAAYTVASTDSPTLTVTGNDSGDGDAGTEPGDGDAVDPGTSDDQQTEEPPTTAPLPDSTPAAQDDPGASTPGGQSDGVSAPGGQSDLSLIWPLGAAVTIGAVALFALAIYRR